MVTFIPWRQRNTITQMLTAPPIDLQCHAVSVKRPMTFHERMTDFRRYWGLGTVIQWSCSCLAWTRLSVLSPVSRKKKDVFGRERMKISKRLWKENNAERVDCWMQLFITHRAHWSVISALRKWRQASYSRPSQEFQASLGHMRPCLK